MNLYPPPRRRWASLAALGCLAAVGLTPIGTPAATAATACKVEYAITSQWPGGFGASVTITNLGDPIDGWRLAWTNPAQQVVTQLWNGSYTQTGSAVTVTNASWNAALATGGSAAFGFTGSFTGSANPVPNSFSLNGTVCTGDPSTTTTGSTTTTSTSPTTTTTTTTTTSGTSPIAVAVSADGRYTITTSQPAAWTFTGTVGRPVTSQGTSSGSDVVGAYTETVFTYADTVSRTAGIRVYRDKPVVLFSGTNQASVANTSSAGAAFPTLTTPALPYRESFQDASFAPFKFGGTPVRDSPVLGFDAQANSYLLSAADNFPVASLGYSNNNATVSAGIVSSAPTLPAGFTHRTVLALGKGINGTYANWGSVLMALGGKKPVANDASPTLNKVGYWTDNGATYYYKYDSSRGYAGTLTAVVQDFAAKGVPLGYLQLDSWWYPKGSVNTWQGGGTDRGGEYAYRAAPALFPNGLPAFQKQVGLPLVTHARWIDSASPYRQQYKMSGDVITDPAFWNSTMDYLSGAGVSTYEQDWLSLRAQPKYNLTDPDGFVGNMARSAAARGIGIQYCMSLPWNYLQGSQYQNLETIRTSDDRFNPNRWDVFLFGSRLAGALGSWPWSDVFMSKETNNLLLSTLSGGMVGVGDALGAQNVANLTRTVRADGVIVKPDAAIVPLDSTYVGTAQGSTPPMIASTYSDHAGLRTGYVFAYARNGGSQTMSFSPAEIGISGSAYVYDYFTGAGSLVPAGGRFSASVGTGSYYVVAPVGASGIALLGDTAKFVSMGSKRIQQVSEGSATQAAVTFVANERSVTLRGYAPTKPTAAAANGTVGAVSYDSGTHLFSLAVSPGTGGTASVTLRLN